MLQRFLDPSVLASISSLDLLARTVVDGFGAASLFYLAIHNQRDAAGLIVFDDEVRNYVRPSTRQGQLHRLLAGLEQAEPHARTDFNKPLLHFQNPLHPRRALVCFFPFFLNTPPSTPPPSAH